MIARALAAALALGLLPGRPGGRGRRPRPPLRPLALTALPGARATGFTLPAVGRRQGLARRAAGQGRAGLLLGHLVPVLPRELPAGIEQVTRERRGQPFTVLAVSIEEPKDLVASWVKGAGVTLPVLLDYDGAVARDYRVTATPTTFVIGRDGRAGGAGRGQPRVGQAPPAAPCSTPWSPRPRSSLGAPPDHGRRVPDRQPRHRHPDPGRGRRRALRGPARGRPLAATSRHGGGEGPARPRRLHPHGPGRLQRGARRARLHRRAPARHPARRRVDQRPGAGVDARQRGARPRARAGGALRLLLRPAPGRPYPPEAVRGPDATTAPSTRATSPASRS